MATSTITITLTKAEAELLDDIIGFLYHEGIASEVARERLEPKLKPRQAVIGRIGNKLYRALNPLTPCTGKGFRPSQN